MQTNARKAAPQKRKRRWFQFSLRSALIFMTICSIPCAWLGRKIDEKRREREAVAAICQLGGYARYDDFFPFAERTGPAWMRMLLGENFFSEVISVQLRFKNIPAGKLEFLEALPQLKSLDLTGATVTDADLTYIRGLISLEELELVRTDVTDAGMKNLKGLTKLKHLNLCGTSVSDAGLADLKQLSQLESLALLVTNVTDEGVDDLRKALPNCAIAYCPSKIPPAEMERYWEANPSLRPPAGSPEAKRSAGKAAVPRSWTAVGGGDGP